MESEPGGQPEWEQPLNTHTGSGDGLQLVLLVSESTCGRKMESSSAELPSAPRQTDGVIYSKAPPPFLNPPPTQITPVPFISSSPNCL